MIGGSQTNRQFAVTTAAAVAEHDRPQPVDGDRLPVRIAHLVNKFTGRGIERVDVAVTEIADQEVAVELTEPGRSECHAPRGIELAVLGESRKHLARQTEGVDD